MALDLSKTSPPPVGVTQHLPVTQQPPMHATMRTQVSVPYIPKVPSLASVQNFVSRATAQQAQPKVAKPPEPQQRRILPKIDQPPPSKPMLLNQTEETILRMLEFAQKAHPEAKDIGWTIIDGIVVPFIIRGQTKFVFVKIVESKLLAKYPSINLEEIENAGPIYSYYLTEPEAKKFTECNIKFFNNAFGRKHFSKEDLIVCLNNFKSFYKSVKAHFEGKEIPTLQPVAQSLPLRGVNEPAKSRIDLNGGWVQINNTVVPYVFRSGVKFVPLPVIKYAANLLNDIRIDGYRMPITELEHEYLNDTCRRAGVNINFAPNTKLIKLELVIRMSFTKVSIKELPKEEPFTHAQYDYEFSGVGNEVSHSATHTSDLSKQNNGLSMGALVPQSLSNASNLGPNQHGTIHYLGNKGVTTVTPQISNNGRLSENARGLKTPPPRPLSQPSPKTNPNPKEGPKPINDPKGGSQSATWRKYPPAPHKGDFRIIITPVSFAGKTVSCLVRDESSGQRYALIEALARLYFPDATFRDFKTTLEDFMGLTITELTNTEEQDFIKFYKLPVKSLKCKGVILFDEFEQTFNQLRYMYRGNLFKGVPTKADMMGSNPVPVSEPTRDESRAQVVISPVIDLARPDSRSSTTSSTATESSSISMSVKRPSDGQTSVAKKPKLTSIKRLDDLVAKLKQKKTDHETDVAMETESTGAESVGRSELAESFDGNQAEHLDVAASPAEQGGTVEQNVEQEREKETESQEEVMNDQQVPESLQVLETATTETAERGCTPEDLTQNLNSKDIESNSNDVDNSHVDENTEKVNLPSEEILTKQQELQDEKMEDLENLESENKIDEGKLPSRESDDNLQFEENIADESSETDQAPESAGVESIDSEPTAEQLGLLTRNAPVVESSAHPVSQDTAAESIENEPTAESVGLLTDEPTAERPGLLTMNAPVIESSTEDDSAILDESHPSENLDLSYPDEAILDDSNTIESTEQPQSQKVASADVNGGANKVLSDNEAENTTIHDPPVSNPVNRSSPKEVVDNSAVDGLSTKLDEVYGNEATAESIRSDDEPMETEITDADKQAPVVSVQNSSAEQRLENPVQTSPHQPETVPVETLPSDSTENVRIPSSDIMDDLEILAEDDIVEDCGQTSDQEALSEVYTQQSIEPQSQPSKEVQSQETVSVAEPLPEVPEPVPVVSEPVSVVPDPVPVVSESASVVPESVQVVSKPASVVPEPVPVVSEPVSAVPEPVPVVSEPASAVPEPVPVVSEPATVVPEPVPVVSEQASGVPVPWVSEPTLLAPKPVPVVSEPALIIPEAVPVVPEQLQEVTEPDAVLESLPVASESTPIIHESMVALPDPASKPVTVVDATKPQVIEQVEAKPPESDNAICDDVTMEIQDDLSNESAKEPACTSQIQSEPVDKPVLTDSAQPESNVSQAEDVVVSQQEDNTPRDSVAMETNQQDSQTNDLIPQTSDNVQSLQEVDNSPDSAPNMEHSDFEPEKSDRELEKTDITDHEPDKTDRELEKIDSEPEKTVSSVPEAENIVSVPIDMEPVPEPSTQDISQAVPVVSETGTPAQTVQQPVTMTNESISKPVVVASEPTTTASEPVTVATEPVTVATEPVKVATDPVTVASDPVKVATEPVKGANEPITVPSEPVKVTTKPDEVANEPVTEASEPVTVPVTVAAEPVTVATEPVTVASGPVTVASEPVPVATEPATASKPVAVANETIPVAVEPAASEAVAVEVQAVPTESSIGAIQLRINADNETDEFS